MSRTFSTKNGSVESLKLRLRCGLTPKELQTRWTVDFDTPVSAAKSLTVQWVQSLGSQEHNLHTGGYALRHGAGICPRLQLLTIFVRHLDFTLRATCSHALIPPACINIGRRKEHTLRLQVMQFIY